jgi:hypothetical protein
LFEGLFERVEGLELHRGFSCRGTIGPRREEGLEPVEGWAFETCADIKDLSVDTGEAIRLALEFHTTFGEEGDKFFLIAGIHRRVRDFRFAGWG